jgi:hypothetical protein
MTEKQINQIRTQLPENEKLDRMYTAFEGDIRVISRDKNGREYRYTTCFDEDDNVTIKRM